MIVAAVAWGPIVDGVSGRGSYKRKLALLARPLYFSFSNSGRSLAVKQGSVCVCYLTMPHRGRLPADKLSESSKVNPTLCRTSGRRRNGFRCDQTKMRTAFDRILPTSPSSFALHFPRSVTSVLTLRSDVVQKDTFDQRDGKEEASCVLFHGDGESLDRARLKQQ